MVAKYCEIFDSDHSAHITTVLLLDICQDGDLDECLFYQFRHLFYNLQCLKLFSLMVEHFKNFAK